MTEDTRTETELIAEALAVQDACNLSGVVHSFSRGMTRLWTLSKDWENRGTYSVNQHRYCRLFASKIESLTGSVELDDFDEI